ncbi:hypothetical protein OG836_04925 [Micromonospora zamorensis]|uniref:hypothetical protein n=1 Tax=Micromonospora zamorensis TaxID=709883 RepID=UPI002E1B3DB7
MGVIPSGAELSRATVIALLSRVFGDDPDLHEDVAGGEYAELVWEGERLGTQWFVHPGKTGVSELVVSIWDAFPLLPAAGFRAEVTRVVEVLQEVAQATGGRFVVQEGDVTGAPLGEVLDMISSDEDDRTPAGMVLSTTAESDEDFLGRYLAAGDERLAWLHDQAARTGRPQRLDHSRDSLAPIWGWAIGRLELRPADAPREKVILENGSVFQRPTDAVLPMWYGRSALLAPHIWSDESLALIDAVAFYAAECVRHAVPELSWQVGHGETRGYVYEGQPVLAGRGHDLEPISSLRPLMGKVYHLRNPDPVDPRTPPAAEDLRDWFDAAVAERRSES